MSHTRITGDAADPLARHSSSPRELKELLANDQLGVPYLAFRDDAGELCFHRLSDAHRRTTVGRRAEADLSIAWDGEVSGVHAELEPLGGEWTIVDDGLSRNGTFVNERRVRGRKRLRNEDRIRVGRTILAFRNGGAGGHLETVAGSSSPAPVLTESQRRVLIALCRPYRDRVGFVTPATNREIAAEVPLGVDAIKKNLRILYQRLQLADQSPRTKRSLLAQRALELGLVSWRELDDEDG
jgi:pSer/pThr/pTyr-binding forkhead associated (FHA) protein